MSEMPAVEIDETAVVILGNFNPAIFSPDWLLAQDLIGADAAAAAEIQLITPDVTHLDIGALSLEVQRSRLQVLTRDVAEAERVRDLASGSLSALRHTPVAALGINRSFHVPVGDVDLFHQFGDRIIPKDPWSEVLRVPGLVNATLRGLRPDNYGGFIQVTVEPSALINLGIFVFQNDHYVFGNRAFVEGRDDPKFLARPEALKPETKHVTEAIDILSKEWTVSFDRATSLVEQVWEIGAGVQA